jgi:putative DNA primase/helicase
MSAPNQLLSAALAYASRGWPVFPCNPRNKKPLIKGEVEGEGGVKLASIDPDQITAWWAKFPKALIALATGHDAGVFVVDLDAGKDDKTGEVYELAALFARLEKEIGARLPPTWVVDTPRGGQHWYFRIPPGLALGNRGDLLGKGSRIDIRGAGGYVFLPPSLRSDGVAYAWASAFTQPVGADDMPAEAPAQLIDCVMRRGKWAPIAATPASPSKRWDPTRPELDASKRGAAARAGSLNAAPGQAADAGDRAVELYASRALDLEIRAVEGEGEGGRNHRLNLAALRLGELVAAGVLDQAEVQARLEAAAEACGLVKEDGMSAVRKTIASGFRKGLRQPRDLSEVRAAAADRARRYRAPAGIEGAGFAGAHFDPAEPDFSAGDPDAPDPDSDDGVEPPDPPPPTGADLEKNLPPGKSSRPGAGWRAGTRGAGGKRKPSPGDPERAEWLNRQLAFFPMTDLGNAERFVERYRGLFRWCPALGWLWWDKCFWNREHGDEMVRQAEHETVRAIQDEAEWLAKSDKDIVVGSRGSGKDKADVHMSDQLRAWGRASESGQRIQQISKHAATYLTVSTKQLDPDPFKINVLNGTLVCLRGTDGPRIEFKGHDPDDLITKLAPVNYDPDASCPEYDKLLELVQPQPAMRRFLAQWGGLSLTGDTSEQKLTFNWGRGKNGKSTVFNAWGYVAGDYGGTINIETFLDQGRPRVGGQATPDLAALQGVRYLRTSEPERNAKMAEALIKLATGGEPMSVRHLNHDFFHMLPSFKLTMSGNYKPTITGTDEGIWRRVRLVPWTVAIPEKDRILDFDKVKLKPEVSGILNRLLAGLLDWMENRLIEPVDVTEATEEYRRDSDPLGRFLEACVVSDDASRVQTSELHRVFVSWCRANSEKEWTPQGFGRAMNQRGFRSKHSDVNFWLGVRLVKTVNDFVDNEGKPLRQSVAPKAAEALETGAPDDMVPL